MIKVFEKLIYPVSINEFFDNYFLKKVLKNKLLFDINFSWNDINEIINTRKVPFHNIFLLVENGQKINPTNIFHVEKHCSNNGSLIINDIHYHNNFLSELIFSLVNDLKCKINSKIIITSQNNSSFTFNYNKDTFLICLDGNVNIRIASDKINEDEYISKNEYLYIPSNYEYMVFSNKPSILLEITIKYNNANDFLEWFIKDILIKDSDFYNNIPLILNDNKEIEIKEEWVNIIDNLKNKFLDKLDSNELEDKFYEYLVKNQEGEKCYKFPYIFMDNIINNIDNYKFKRKDFMDSVFEYNEDSVTIYFWQKKISFDIKFKNILTFIFNSFNFDDKDLINIDPNLSNFEILDLINILIKNDLIEVEN